MNLTFAKALGDDPARQSTHRSTGRWPRENIDYLTLLRAEYFCGPLADGPRHGCGSATKAGARSYAALTGRQPIGSCSTDQKAGYPLDLGVEATRHRTGCQTARNDPPGNRVC